MGEKTREEEQIEFGKLALEFLRRNRAASMVFPVGADKKIMVMIGSHEDINSLCVFAR